MGDDKFDSFLKELFKLNSIDYGRFEELVLRYIPDFKNNLYIWLNTTEYDDELHSKQY